MHLDRTPQQVLQGVRIQSSAFSFEEGLINGDNSAVSLVNHKEQVVVITITIHRDSTSRGRTNEVVHVVTISSLSVQLGLDVRGNTINIVQLSGGSSDTIQQIKLSSSDSSTIKNGNFISSQESECSSGTSLATTKSSKISIQRLLVVKLGLEIRGNTIAVCLLYTSPSPRDRTRSRMPSSA